MVTSLLFRDRPEVYKKVEARYNARDPAAGRTVIVYFPTGEMNMNNRERALAILNYKPYDRLPIVHFGFWNETLARWADEGHITHELAHAWGDGNAADHAVGGKLGFDFNWYRVFGVYTNLLPPFERKVLEVLPDGTRKEVNSDGVVILQKDDATGIPTEIDHLFKGRKEWDELFKPRLLPEIGRAHV